MTSELLGIKQTVNIKKQFLGFGGLNLRFASVESNYSKIEFDYIFMESNSILIKQLFA